MKLKKEQVIKTVKVIIWGVTVGLVCSSLEFRTPLSTWQGWAITMMPILLWVVDWSK